MYIWSIQPKSPDSDFIENKTTFGGLTLIKSMLNISFATYAKPNASNVCPTTGDLNRVRSNQPKTKFRVRTELLPLIR